jgi:hypothetical protein
MKLEKVVPVSALRGLPFIVIHGHWKSRLQKKMEANQSPDLKGNRCQISAQYKSI